MSCERGGIECGFGIPARKQVATVRNMDLHGMMEGDQRGCRTIQPNRSGVDLGEPTNKDDTPRQVSAADDIPLALHVTQ